MQNKDTDAVTVLLVEDDDVDAHGIQREFAKAKIGNPLVRAKDGLEALELLRDNAVSKPYIILLDLQMPRMNGLEFLQALRADPDLHKSVVFVLTTSNSEESITASYEKHVAGYCLKDDPGNSFLQIIKMLDGYWRVVCLPS